MVTVDKFEEWAVVEIMGHKKFSGRVTEQSIGGVSFVRVDVPEVALPERTLPAFSKLFGAGSIYCISPCTEETARAFAEQIRSESFQLYEAPRLSAPQVNDDDDDDSPVFGHYCDDDDYDNEHNAF